MNTATPDLIKSSPSPLRIGLVRSRFTVVLYLLVVGLQFLTNLAINGIVDLSVSDINKNAEQSATNSAFVTGTSSPMGCRANHQESSHAVPYQRSA